MIKETHIKLLEAINDKQRNIRGYQDNINNMTKELEALIKKLESPDYRGNIYEELGIKCINLQSKEACVCYSTSESGMSICGCKGSGHSPK